METNREVIVLDNHLAELAEKARSELLEAKALASAGKKKDAKRKILSAIRAAEKCGFCSDKQQSEMPDFFGDPRLESAWHCGLAVSSVPL